MAVGEEERGAYHPEVDVLGGRVVARARDLLHLNIVALEEGVEGTAHVLDGHEGGLLDLLGLELRGSGRK